MGLAEDFENSRIERYKKQFNTEERRMFLFKCFISFLELWGEENYGNSSIVDWVKVHNYVCYSNIITFSIEIDNLVKGDLDAMKFFTYKEIDDNKRGLAHYNPKDITDKWVMNDKVMKKHCSGFVPSDKVKNYDDYIKLYYNI